MKIFTAASAAFVAAALTAAPAAAQPARLQPIGETAADLAFGLCPLFLSGQLALNSPELAQRGFGTTVLRQAHPTMGAISLVSAKLPDGEIAFGGASGKACTVVTNSKTPAAVLATLHTNMAFMGLDFKPAPAPGPAVAGIKPQWVETFQAPVENQILYVQLVRMGGASGNGPVVAQLFVVNPPAQSGVPATPPAGGRF